jgi:hypothetical protein
MAIDTQHLPSPAAPVPPKKNWFDWFLRHKFITGAAVIVAIGIGAAGPGSNSTDSKKPSTPSAAADKDASVDTTRDLKALLADEIGDDRTVVADVSADSVLVKFNISDNLTEHLIGVGIQKDVLDILKVVHAKHPGLHTTVSGLFPLVDKYGKESIGQVLLLNYSPDTLDKINYESIGLDVVALADPSPQFVHPDFKL